MVGFDSRQALQRKTLTSRVIPCRVCVPPAHIAQSLLPG